MTSVQARDRDGGIEPTWRLLSVEREARLGHLASLSGPPLEITNRCRNLLQMQQKVKSNPPGFIASIGAEQSYCEPRSGQWYTGVFPAVILDWMI